MENESNTVNTEIGVENKVEVEVNNVEVNKAEEESTKIEEENTKVEYAVKEEAVNEKHPLGAKREYAFDTPEVRDESKNVEEIIFNTPFQ